jgi:hypothetical protein
VKLVVQKLRRTVNSPLNKAIKYYTALAIFTDKKITQRQIELVAFMAVRGNITSPAARKEFIELFSSSYQSIENIKSKLTKQKWLVKIDGRYKVNPAIQLDFSKNIILQINITEENEEVYSGTNREGYIKETVIEESV